MIRDDPGGWRSLWVFGLAIDCWRSFRDRFDLAIASKEGSGTQLAPQPQTRIPPHENRPPLQESGFIVAGFRIRESEWISLWQFFKCPEP